MRRILTLAACSMLTLPSVLLAAPAQATETATTADAAHTCAKTQHGLTVRIKMRDTGKFTRIRVSHPRGRGVFREPRLHHVTGGVSWFSTPPPDEKGRQISGSAIDKRHRLKPVFRSISVSDGYSRVAVSAIFTLDNGKVIRLSCSLR
jgi:hypothetical protein